MSEANPQQEPSMEEILASIRRIISEDDKPESGAAASKAPDDVLELTEVAEEEESAPDPQPQEKEPKAEEEPAQEAAADLSIDEVLKEVDTDDELELRDRDAAAAPPPPPRTPEAGLLAAETEAAAGGSLSSLVAAVDRAHGGSSGNRTIEDLVKEVMRPLVKEWLDENLPRLTERLVRREIERLSRNAEGD